MGNGNDKEIRSHQSPVKQASNSKRENHDGCDLSGSFSSFLTVLIFFGVFFGIPFVLIVSDGFEFHFRFSFLLSSWLPLLVKTLQQVGDLR